MRLYCFLLIPLILLLSSCTSAFSIRADARPKFTAVALSAQLSTRYAQMGFAVDTLSRPTKEEFTLGRWFSARRGFIGHSERDGILQIWIAPRPQQDDAATVVEDLKKIIGEMAPSAIVTIRESQTPDWR